MLSLYTTATGDHSPVVIEKGDRVAVTERYLDLVPGLLGTVKGFTHMRIRTAPGRKGKLRSACKVLIDGRKECVKIPRYILTKKTW
jgi:hypothetical protein